MAGDRLDAEARHILERRRLRRRLGFWRLAAVVALLAAVGAVSWRLAPTGDHVARVSVFGTIVDDPDRDAMIRDLARDASVQAVILRIDSPGGTVAGSEALYEALRELATFKPVAAVMGEVAASGGYAIALAADRIVARGSTLTGSIGVVAEYPNIERLLETVGVGISRVASAPLKAEPSPFRAPDEAVLAAQRALIADAYAWFLGLVTERRGLDETAARQAGDGRVFSGRQALALGLVDALGGEPEARAWLAEARGVPVSLPVRDVEPERDAPWFAALLDVAAGRGALMDWAQGPRLLAVMR